MEHTEDDFLKRARQKAITLIEGGHTQQAALLILAIRNVTRLSSIGTNHPHKYEPKQEDL
ncbi:MAG: hypothetical protein HY073_03835 [Deltaproteobacteria bacterium]|nr:hypothetical protein [Deltaproteobacteria bacterium]